MFKRFKKPEAKKKKVVKEVVKVEPIIVVPEPTIEIQVAAIEKEKMKRVIVECTGKISNYMLRGWWVVAKDKISNTEYPADIFERIQKGELIVLERQ